MADPTATVPPRNKFQSEPVLQANEPDPQDYPPLDEPTDSLQEEEAQRNDTTDGEYENVDHIARMRELIAQLPDASPSGATTIAQKLNEHLDAHINPDAYNERQARIRKQHQDEEKRRAERREQVKEPVEGKQEDAKAA